MKVTSANLDRFEDQEFVSANGIDKCHTEEDRMDVKKEDKMSLTQGKAAKTEIQEFYKNQCVFITGGTGFLGKVLIEKLLRSCGDVDAIYVLIRNKKGKDPKARLHELLEDFLFQKVHKENPKSIHKLVPIVGDCEKPGLDISDEDRKTLISRVTIIIHGAATVRFDEILSVSNAINVRGSTEMLSLAKECKNLKAFTHVSTAYANTHMRHIEEKFYKPPLTVEALDAISAIDQNVVDGILPALLGERPNTYCFTKAIAEDAIRQGGAGMPICILRPSIVISTYEEPIRGWTDSVYGPTGLIVGIGTGVLRTMYVRKDKVADMVPVDLCVNAIIASAWYTAKNFKQNETSDIPIYNFVSGAQNPITWRDFIQLNAKYSMNLPTIKAVWYYGLTLTANYYLFLFLNFFLHFLPAFLMDTYLALTGKRRVMLKLYNKIMKAANTLFYFSTKQWKFSDMNVQDMWKSLSEEDRTVFPFSIGEMSWDRLCETFLLGLRVYLIKDDLSTLPAARKKWNRPTTTRLNVVDLVVLSLFLGYKLYYLHQAVKLTALALFVYLVYLLLAPVINALFG